MENKELIIVIKNFVDKANDAATRYKEIAQELRDKTTKDDHFLPLAKMASGQWQRYKAFVYAIGTIINECKIKITYTELGLIIM